MIEKIKNKLGSDANLKELLTGSAITFVLKIGGMGLGYVLIYLISQRLGAEGVGFYNLILQTLTVLGMIFGLGMNISVLRYVGQFDNDGERHKMHDLYKHFVSMVGPLTVLVSIMLYFGAPVITEFLDKEPEYKQGLRLVALVLPFFTINQISVEFIRGMRRLQISELIRSVLRPLIMVLGMFLFFGNGLSKMDVIYLLVLALFINSLVSRLTIWGVLRPVIREREQFRRTELLRTSLPMMLTGIASGLLVAMPIFFLDYYWGQAEVGVYSVAFRLAGLVSLVLVVVNTIAAPKFAELYWANRKKELQEVITLVSKITFWISLVTSVILIFGAEFWLGFFGDGFVKGETALVILVFGQFVNSITGPAGTMLNMSGNQKIVGKLMIVSTAILPLLYVFVVPRFSLEGCALVSIAGGAVSVNTLMVFLAYKRLGLITVYIPKFNLT